MGVRDSKKDEEDTLLILYTNADCLLNKMHDLEYMLKSLIRKPHVIAVTEVNSKVNTKFIISEISIPGYQIFHNIEFQGKRGVVLCYVGSFGYRSTYVNYIGL